MKQKGTSTRFWRTATEFLFASFSLAVLTFIAFRLHAPAATVAVLFFFFIVLISVWVGFVTAVFICLQAILSFDYFFTEPRFELRMSDPLDLVALIAFSSTAFVITRMMSRVEERTTALRKANEQLRAEIVERTHAEEASNKAQADLAHVTRIMTMGELAASVAHEVNQPISAIVINGNSCLRWLAGEAPNLDEAREAAGRIVRDGKRAGDIIARIRALAKKTGAVKERLDMNEAIREVVALAGYEVRRNGVTLRLESADDLSPVSGDRVQLQQVLLNLIMNGVEAMSTVGERPRELVIRTQNDDADHVRVTVQDSGMGLDPQSMERIFDAFYTTKHGGMGMGLSISRSIVQNHGGRLWAVANDSPGTTLHFTVQKDR